MTIKINTIRKNNKLSWVQLLDQTQPKKYEKSYNPSKELIMKEIIIIDKISQRYGVTFTFKSKWHIEDPIWLHRHIQQKINNSRVWKNVKFILFPEFTKNGILHYHGIIYDCYQIIAIKLITWWRRTYGFAKPELELRHYDKWCTYIMKNYGKTGLWTLHSIKGRAGRDLETVNKQE